MKNIVIGVGVILSLFTLSACVKYGCTDKAALNYDPKAKVRDRSCKYFVDAYVGKYVGIDSATSQVNDTMNEFIGKSNFQIIEINEKELSMLGFVYQIEALFINSNPTNFIDSTNYGTFRLIGSINLQKDTFHYNMSLINDSILLENHHGFGVKQ